MNINVPGPVATYLAADKAKDTEMLGQCFREGAVVRARVTGDFPGSPVERRFTFAISDDRIVWLEVTP